MKNVILILLLCLATASAFADAGVSYFGTSINAASGGGGLTIQAPEYICTELGSACTCSEPLSSTGQSFSGTSHNPPDSSTKECGTFETDATVASITAPNPPTGAIIESAYQLQDYNSWGHTTKMLGVVPSGDKRVCFRHYSYYPSGYASSGWNWSADNDSMCQRVKLHQFSNSGGSTLFQPEWKGSTPYPTADVITGAVSGTPTLTSGSDVQLNDVKGHWVRHEACMDANSFGSGSATVYAAQTRITVPDTGDTATYTMSGYPTSGVDMVMSSSFFWVGNFYDQRSACGAGGNGRSIAYVMQAEFARGSGTWIGAACEMEPGAAGCP